MENNNQTTKSNFYKYALPIAILVIIAIVVTFLLKSNSNKNKDGILTEEEKKAIEENAMKDFVAIPEADKRKIEEQAQNSNGTTTSGKIDYALTDKEKSAIENRLSN